MTLGPRSRHYIHVTRPISLLRLLRLEMARSSTARRPAPLHTKARPDGSHSLTRRRCDAPRRMTRVIIPVSHETYVTPPHLDDNTMPSGMPPSYYAAPSIMLTMLTMMIDCSAPIIFRPILYIFSQDSAHSTILPSLAKGYRRNSLSPSI